MIDHTCLQVSDPVVSREFYDKALAPLGYKMMVQIPKEHTGGVAVFGYGVPPKADFWVGEGTPNAPRVHVYGAFVLDPDGHNVEAVCHGPK
jgi:catechol 2,3-dioxygenase-like lactoylglutathione lyase family enzyme